MQYILVRRGNKMDSNYIVPVVAVIGGMAFAIVLVIMRTLRIKSENELKAKKAASSKNPDLDRDILARLSSTDERLKTVEKTLSDI